MAVTVAVAMTVAVVVTMTMAVVVTMTMAVVVTMTMPMMLLVMDFTVKVLIIARFFHFEVVSCHIWLFLMI